MSTPTALQLLASEEPKPSGPLSSTANDPSPFIMAPRTILVMGATGKQGAATIAQLCALPNSKTDLRILGVTRNTSSDGAFDIKEPYPQVELLQGDYADLAALFDMLPATPYAVFSVQPTMYRGYTQEKEVQQGRALHEAAIDIGVRHIVYTSVDRHGPEDSERASGVPHFDSKLDIEQHLTAECARSKKTTWTILRPTTFFDNYTPDLQGRVVAATFGQAIKGQQMVAVKDIGWFAARALVEPEKYSHRKISLAGDSLTLEQMRDRFYGKLGYQMPEAYSWVGSGALWASKELGSMYKWLNEVGYGADIKEVRTEHPGLLTFAQWVEKESKFTRGGEVLGSYLG